jgi:ABC-type tungstate transport system substrate-binding protein
MYRRLLDAVGVSLVISGFIGAETAVITSSEYHPLADGNSETYSADGVPILTLTVVRGATLDIMPRR